MQRRRYLPPPTPHSLRHVRMSKWNPRGTAWGLSLRCLYETF